MEGAGTGHLPNLRWTPIMLIRLYAIPLNEELYMARTAAPLLV
jgi:hypothetical protein